jgi:beta-phosphoglucomutase-like phosphatase (HAD superfamily)
MSPVSYGPSDIVNPRGTPFAGMVPESFWLTKVLIFDFDWIIQEIKQGAHPMPDHPESKTLVSGLKETFRLLRAFEIRIAMTSNKRLKTVVEELHRFGLAEDFDCIRCAEELPSLKPNPDLHLNVMETLGVRPVKAIALETSHDGTQAAKAAGLFCVGTPDLNGNADFHLTSITEQPIIPLLEQMDRLKRRQLGVS